jgi:hypothetical protein
MENLPGPKTSAISAQMKHGNGSAFTNLRVDTGRPFGTRIEHCLRRLVQAGADINAANDEGITVVHAATWGFDAGRVKCLLELAADPRIATRDGATPLSVAQAKGHAAMADALIGAAQKKGNA